MHMHSTIKIVLIYSDHWQSVKDQIGRFRRKKTSKLDHFWLRVRRIKKKLKLFFAKLDQLGLCCSGKGQMGSKQFLLC